MTSTTQMDNLRKSLQREDEGRWGLLVAGLSGLLFMKSTSPPILDKLRTIEPPIGER